MIRVVIDPGVFVSALISRRRAAPGLIADALLEGQFVAVASPLLIRELAEVLARPKFERATSEGRAERFVAAIIECCAVVADPAIAPGATADPDDDYLVALARAHGAEAIVSGDRHLLEADLEDMSVLTPREFADALALYGARYVEDLARIASALRQTASLEHAALVIARPVGEAIAVHATPDGRVWWASTHDPDDLAVLRGLVRGVRADDEDDVTTLARAFDPEGRERAGLDELFGSTLIGFAAQVTADLGVLLARDAVERVWLAWRYEDGHVYAVEETPAFFDEHLKAVDAFARWPTDGDEEKPPLRLAPVGSPRVLEMDDQLAEAVEGLRELFRKKFGRDPGPDDPLVFDPDADEPRPMPEKDLDRIYAVMEEFGFDEEWRQRRETQMIAEGRLRRIGRNDPCPCGSGQEFKRCHGA